MAELWANIEPIKIALTLLILAATVYGFVSERIPPDLTALLALLALLITRILTPMEAFAGFSHPSTVSVAAMLVLSAAIERTGALSFLARRLLVHLGHSELLFTIVIMLMIALMSAFINNTAAVAVFIPLVLDACQRYGFNPGRVLMPMSHAATFGGMCTLIGTSTNLVAHEYASDKGLPGFSMFELGKVGIPMLVAGFVWVLLVGRGSLGKNRSTRQRSLTHDEQYLVEVMIRPDSPWIGREVSPGQLRRDADVELAGLLRNKQVLSPAIPSPRYLGGDSLLLRGTLDALLKLAGQEGLELHRPESHRFTIDNSIQRLPASESGADAEVAARGEEGPMLAEVIILSTSELIGQTLKEARFAERYDAVVLALRRRGMMSERPSTTPLRAGDVLVVEGMPEALGTMVDESGFLVIGTPSRPEQRPGSLIITLLTLLAVVVVVSLNLAPIVVAATSGCAMLMLTGCLRPREAYQAIDLSIVFLLAGSLSLGLALEKTGVTILLAAGLQQLTGFTGPFLVLAGFFLTAVIISELMSNGGTVALLAPVAITSATQLGINPMALMAAITFGSSAAFAMPIGYQTSLMIFGPGGYRVRDFVRMGIPLDLLLAALAFWLIPIFWPLTGP